MNDKKQILKTLTILYAEDDPNTRENTFQTLEMLVHNVIAVKNGIEALEMFEKKTCHIVLLDYVMPSLDGNGVAQRIREKNSDIPIVMLSSHVEKEKLMNAIKTGVNDYLEKPIHFDMLLTTLLNCVQKIIDSGKFKTHLCDNIEYDYIQKSLHTPTKSERLTKHEYFFLEMLLERPGSLVSKDEIEQRVFGGEVEPNALRNLVYRLRKKIDTELIVTIKDLGYILNLS